MAEIICALAGYELFEDGAECVANGIEGAWCHSPEQLFDFSEDLLDRIEVGAVGRKVEQSHACVLEAVADAGDLVGWQIVRDDDAAGRHFRDQVFNQPLAEDFAGHRRVDQHRRENAVMLQSRYEGGGHPVTMRCLAEERLAFMAPAMRSCHARGRAGLIDEHQRCEVEPGLRRLPDRTRYRDVGPVLLAGVDCSFFKRSPSFFTVRHTLV